MSETPATYGPQDRAADPLKAEALAVRHVFNLPPDEREDAAAHLSAATMVLVGLAADVHKARKKTPGLLLVDVAAMMGRPALREEAEALRAAGAADLLDPAKAQDPEACAAAFSKALENTAKAANRRQAEEAAKLLARVDAAPTAEAGRGLLDDAAERLERLQRQTETPLAEAWEAHLAAKAAPVAGPHEVLRLDKRRGPWAAWMNDNLGPRGGLEAGETFILGGGPEAGKTSMAALLAVDAMAAGCPVLFWQLELSREETLEHLQAQRPDLEGWPFSRYWNEPWNKTKGRAFNPIPDAWADLLTVPRWADSNMETIVAAMQDQARKMNRAERAGKTCHKVRGLVVVDYCQLLTLEDRKPRDAGHEVLTTAASRLAHAAADCGACLLLLSQMNKQDQRETAAAGTALAGADLARMAHRVALLQKAAEDGTACKAGDAVAWNKDNGEARLLTWTKARGVRYTPEGHRPEKARGIWYAGQARAFHGGDAPKHTMLGED